MNVLVTGASGFVGRALVDELRHGDGAYEVHPLERSDGDLAEEGVADAAIAEARPDVVVHAAARIGVVRDEEPERTLRSNVLATTLVARAASAHGALSPTSPRRTCTATAAWTRRRRSPLPASTH